MHVALYYHVILVTFLSAGYIGPITVFSNYLVIHFKDVILEIA